MCLKFSKIYLLIECQGVEDFKRENFSYGVNSITGERFNINIRRQLLELMFRYPRLRIIWSSSIMHSISIITELKKNQPEPEINKFRPQSEAH